MNKIYKIQEQQIKTDFEQDKGNNDEEKYFFLFCAYSM